MGRVTEERRKGIAFTRELLEQKAMKLGGSIADRGSAAISLPLTVLENCRIHQVFSNNEKFYSDEPLHTGSE